MRHIGATDIEMGMYKESFTDYVDGRSIRKKTERILQEPSAPENNGWYSYNFATVVLNTFENRSLLSVQLVVQLRFAERVNGN